MIKNIFAFDFGSPHYDESIHIRYKILRAPLNLTFTEKQLSREWQDFHIGIFSNEMEMLGCLVMQPISDTEIKMRQVAILNEHQGKGLGKALVYYTERFVKEKGFSKITMNARKSAISFYEGLDYKKIGEEFEEVGIPHFKMEKNIV